MTTTNTTTSNELPKSPHYLRITSQAKLKCLVSFSLKYFEVCTISFMKRVNPNRLRKDVDEIGKVLVLHTLPPPVAQKILRTGTNVDEVDAHEQKTAKPNPDSDVPQTTEGSTTASIPKITEITPKLITVVEIIKREYIKLLEIRKSTRFIGLHQYNQIGSIDNSQLPNGGSSLPVKEHNPEVVEAERSQNILKALEGKNYLKQTQTPYMVVTLSTEPLPQLAEQGASYQPPAKRVQSKSAKARAKKREKKAATASSSADKDDIVDAPSDRQMDID
ncbi:hypothetical protein ONZ45_g16541 [Pleurotus djamor]|nr:hypothetical protein ONZ45_g16541 [Pleurotus djamor]